MLHAGNSVGTVQAVLRVLQPGVSSPSPPFRLVKSDVSPVVLMSSARRDHAVTGGDIRCRTAGLQRDGVVTTQ